MRGYRGLALAGLLFTGATAPVSAQTAAIAAQFTGSRDEDLTPMWGASAGISFWHDRLQLRVGAVTGSERRIDIPCGGLSPPDADCRPQPVRLDTELWTTTLAYRFPLLASTFWRARLDVHIGAVKVEMSKRSIEGASAVRDKSVLPLLGVRAEVARALWAGAPIEIGLGVGADGAYDPLMAFGCVDCYEPFMDGLGLLTASAGLAYVF